MPLLKPSDWSAAQAIATIGFTNPFLPERIALEKRALGDAFVSSQPFLHYRADSAISDIFPNVPMLRGRCEQLLAVMREKLLAGESATPRELMVYEDLVMYLLYARYMSVVLDMPLVAYSNRDESDILQSYDPYVADFDHYFVGLAGVLPSSHDRDTIFAGLFQVERAFFHIFNFVVGGSSAAAQLRAEIWQSIFTHDMRRYIRSLHQHMGDVPTLITGPSGTGKELVAKAIGFSRFVEFDSKKRRFVIDYTQCFVALNLAAFAPTLIESELFGHAKGAFTDAKGERAGFLDEQKANRWSTVFLDEIGEIDGQLQVKLLRVLQNREFQRIGDRQTRQFVGKIVAATNRDLSAEMQAGRFREDFYYRLCADRIETPSLRSQLAEFPEDLMNFVQFIARRLLPEIPEEVERLTREATSWIDINLGSSYAWPGNIRELEQCVRSIMIRGRFVPARCPQPAEESAMTKFLAKIEGGQLRRDELVTAYVSSVYAKLGSYQAAAQQLGADWRTIKKLVDDDLAKAFGEH